nr:hypothetical protein [uncultured Cohaesibacter sp.]
MKLLTQSLLSCLLLLPAAACVPAKIQGEKLDGTKISVLYYPGGPKLDDLVILDGQNYFGKVSELKNDPANDIQFKLVDGKTFIAECTAVQLNKDKTAICMEYDVYRTDDEAIPEGTVFYRPRWLQ